MSAIPAPQIAEISAQGAMIPSTVAEQYSRAAQFQQQTQASKQAMQETALRMQAQQQELQDRDAYTNALREWYQGGQAPASQQPGSAPTGPAGAQPIPNAVPGQVQAQPLAAGGVQPPQRTSGALDPQDLAGLVLKHGGSAQAAMSAMQGIVAQKEALSKLSDEQLAHEAKITDLHKGIISNLQGIDDPQEYQTAYTNGIQSLIRAGDKSVMNAPIQAPPKEQLAQYLPAAQAYSAIQSQEKARREAEQEQAKARSENATAAHQEFINKLTENSKPGDFDNQVDQIYPPNAAQSGGQNRMTKSLLNGALQRGDLEGAKKILEDAYQNVQGVNKEIAVNTNPQIQAGKVQVAAAEGAAKASVEAASARGSNAALASVPAHLVAPASAAANKAGEDYAQSKSVSDRLSAMMDAAKKGNVVSYQLIPQEGALQVTTSQGVHRINMAEIQNYGGGSLWQQMQGHIGKALSGKSIPDSVLNDMAQMQDIQSRGSQTKYENALNTINQTYGSNFKPVEMKTMENAAAQQHIPGGAATGLKEGATGTGTDHKKYVVKGGVWVAQQ